MMGNGKSANVAPLTFAAAVSWCELFFYTWQPGMQPLRRRPICNPHPKQRCAGFLVLENLVLPAVLILVHIDVDAVSCAKCPDNAQCTGGQLRASQNFFALLKPDGTAQVAQCPTGLCLDVLVRVHVPACICSRSVSGKRI